MKTALVGSSLLVLAFWAVPGSADDGDRGPRPELKQKLLEKFDADGDGKLSEQERTAAKKALAERRAEAGKEGGPRGGGDSAQRSRPSREEILKKFDENGDGKLDAAEREKAKAAYRERQGQRGRELPPALKEKLLKEFDADGDGKLNEQERQKAKAAMRERVRDSGGPRQLPPQLKEKLLKEFDANGDGQLTGEEREKAQAFMKKMRERNSRGDRPGRPGSEGKKEKGGKG